VTKDLIQQLEQRRNAKILTLIYSDGAFMDDRDVDLVYEMLEDLCEGEKVEKIEVILSSLGGEISAAVGLVKTIRRYCDKFNVLIPRRAKSGASLLALGADKIYMGKISELGPIDPIVSHPMMPVMIPARCPVYFIEKVLPKVAEMGVEEYFLKVDYSHVAFCIMAAEQGREYARRLLTTYHFKGQANKLRQVDDIVKKLTEYPSHDFVIDIDEAKALGLNVEELSINDWVIIYSLYREYKKKLDGVALIIETTKDIREVKRPKLTLW